jgi:hypothetical protein
MAFSGPAAGTTVGNLIHPHEVPVKRVVVVVDCTTGRSAGLAPLRIWPYKRRLGDTRPEHRFRSSSARRLREKCG